MAKKKYYETDDFKELQKSWYGKLKDSGFNDVENFENENMIQPEIFKVDKVQSFGGSEYYDFCQAVLREYNFERHVDQLIFELHTEGKSVREIEIYLQNHSDKKLKYRAINDVINKIKKDFQGHPK